ncbi:hypothetical protein SAMN05216525_106204 [Bradyrhizobium sp. Gha]|nr:hypothetical protein SAMN05216525_106204 [Bradyrhizobium sp. Gha]
MIDLLAGQIDIMFDQAGREGCGYHAVLSR